MEDVDLLFELARDPGSDAPPPPIVPWPYWLDLLPELRSEIRGCLDLAERACLVRTSTAMRAEDTTVDLSFPTDWRSAIDTMLLDGQYDVRRGASDYGVGTAACERLDYDARQLMRVIKADGIDHWPGIVAISIPNAWFSASRLTGVVLDLEVRCPNAIRTEETIHVLAIYSRCPQLAFSNVVKKGQRNKFWEELPAPVETTIALIKAHGVKWLETQRTDF